MRQIAWRRAAAARSAGIVDEVAPAQLSGRCMRNGGKIGAGAARKERDMRRVSVVWFVVWMSLTASTGAAGVLTVDSAAHSFGAILAGEVVSHAFVLTNTGDATVNVTNVKASCRCTTPSWTSATLAPGASFTLIATFNSLGFNGQEAKTVTVSYTSGGQSAKLLLVLSATVVKPEPQDTTTGALEVAFRILVDVRSADAYAARHFIGALNIPYDELGSSIGALPRGVFIVVYDQDGSRAAAAARVLRTGGYADLEYLQGGLDSWTEAYGNRFATSGPATAERFVLAAEPVSSFGGAPLKGMEAEDVKKGFLVLVDLRSPEAYAAAHFAGAVNVQPADLLAWVTRLPNDARIVLYDQDNSLARSQAVALRGARHPNVQALWGGLAGWRATFGDRLLCSS
jgi:rhodanese-related sulfurtransferase